MNSYLIGKLKHKTNCPKAIPFVFLKRFYLFLEKGEGRERERGREGERVGEKHQCVVASPVSPTGDLAHNPDMCPDWESNQRPFASQPGAQSTEPCQTGPFCIFLR